MSKVVLINDTHFGVKSDSPVFREYIEGFLNNTLFPYIKDNNIKKIIHLGDVLDKRKYVNIETLKFVKDKFFNPLKEMGVELHIILGNHDCFYRNTSDVNSVVELFSHYENIRIYENPQDLILYDTSIAILPWINSGNKEKFDDFIKNTKSKIAMGHLQLEGFQVLRGIFCNDGLSKSLFAKFETVYSGHFHQKHDDGHIFYLGTQYDLTFSDVNEKKGFHVLDLKSRELEFVENPDKIFFRLVYDEENENKGNDTPDFSKYKNTFVKLVVKKKTNSTKFEKYLDTLIDNNPSDISIVEDYDIFNSDGIEGDGINIDESEDTVSLISKEIDLMEVANPNLLKSLINDLYNESFEIKMDNDDE